MNTITEDELKSATRDIRRLQHKVAKSMNDVQSYLKACISSIDSNISILEDIEDEYYYILNEDISEYEYAGKFQDRYSHLQDDLDNLYRLKKIISKI